MRKGARAVVWTLLGAGVFAAALAAAALLLPGLARSGAFRARMLAEASRAAGGPVTFERLDIVLFPRPGVIARGAAVAIPGTLAGTADSVSVYPEILPLLKGTFRPARVDAKAPSFHLRLPTRTRKPGEPVPTLADIERRIASYLAQVSSRVPSLAVSVRDGRFDISDESGALLPLREVAGHVGFSRDALAVRLACRSSLFARLSATARLDPERLTGRGRIEIAQLRPRSLAARLFPGGPLPAADAVADLSADFRAGGIGVIEADVDASAPPLDLSRGDRRRTLGPMRISGTVREDRGTTTVTVRDLVVGSPKLRASGRVLHDRLTPRVTVDADVADADLGALRDAAVALAGDVLPVRRFFDVVRGGRVAPAAVRLRAARPEELLEPGSIAATARVTDGAIHVPAIGLDLAAARGDVTFSGGILRARGISADVGHSRGSEGSLTLGMEGAPRALRLDARIRADLSELPPLLARLIRSKAARDAIAGIEESRGEAEGRLTLDGTTASVATRVDAARVRLLARYRGIPFPVAVSRGRFSYDRGVAAVAGMDGTAGRSSFAGLTGQIALGGETAVDVSSGRLVLALGELHPWLSSFEEARSVLEWIGALDGTATVSVARLQGPLSDLRRWRYDVAGSVEGLRAVTSNAPGRVEIDEGEFRASAGSVSFANVRGRLLDASVTAAGALRGPGAEGGGGFALSLAGTIGPEAALWASDLSRLPEALRVATPLSLAGGRVSRTPDGATSFSGTLAFRNGPTVVLNVRKTTGGLAVDRLDVKDAESDAAIALRMRRTDMSATFRGTLASGTVERIYPGNPVRRGRIAGRFEADVTRDRAAGTSLRGTLEGRDILVSLPGGDSLAVEAVALTAGGSVVRIRPSPVTWREQRISVDGIARFDAGGVRLDLNLGSDRLDADKVLAGLAPAAAGAPEQVPAAGPSATDRTEGRRLYDAPVSGNLRLKAKFLRAGRYTWSPFHADVVISPEGATVFLDNAAVCGIAARGSLSAAARDIAVDITATAANADVERALECLTGKRYGATGRFTFRGRAAGRGAPATIVSALKGDFAFEAAKGRIRRFNLLSKILAVVNVTEIFRGRVPDLGKSGFAYDSIKAAGTIGEGKLVLADGASIDGRSMGILVRGSVDLRDRNADLVALVAPLRTVDAIVRRIPVLRYILGGSLVSFPVAIRGNIDDPAISPLPPSEVGAGMLGLLERILKTPVKVIEPVIGGLEPDRSGGHHQGYQP